MKKSLCSAAAILALIGFCNTASAELLCDDGGPSAKQSARKGCIAEKPARARSATSTSLAESRDVPGSSGRTTAAGVSPASPKGRAVAGGAAIAPPAHMHWELKASDLSIYGAIMRWADVNGWQVSWELAHDFPVTIQASFDDNFRGAVDSVLNAYKDTEVAPKGCFYENKVLRVVRRVGDERECEIKSN